MLVAWYTLDTWINRGGGLELQNQGTVHTCVLVCLHACMLASLSLLVCLQVCLCSCACEFVFACVLACACMLACACIHFSLRLYACLAYLLDSHTCMCAADHYKAVVISFLASSRRACRLGCAVLFRHSTGSLAPLTSEHVDAVIRVDVSWHSG